jgi:hypothetical protein
LHSKITETRGLKKLRLEGQETAAYITSWDEELHETRRKSSSRNPISDKQLTSPTDKQSAHQEHGAILRSLVDPICTIHYIGSPILVHENDEITTSPNISQIPHPQDRDMADHLRASQETRLFLKETPSTNRQELHRCNSEHVSTQTPPPDEHPMAEEPDSGGEQDLTEQKLGEQLPVRGDAIDHQPRCLTADEQVKSAVDGREVKGEDMPLTSQVKNDTTGGEQISSKNPTGRAAEDQLDAPLEEALKDDTAAEQQQQVNSINIQTPPLQAQITNETPEEKTRNNFGPQDGNKGSEDGHAILQEWGPDFNTALNDGASRQPQPDDLRPMSGPGSTQDELPMTREIHTTDSVENENVLPESPLRQDLPTQAHYHSSKAPAVVQDEDTDYLHAFLTRAKAKKAAREASPQKVDRVPSSPMTRSRAALVPLSTNSASPKKTNKHQLYSSESDVVETNKSDSPCRRSGRIRLPRPQKAPTVTPSTIPVRRSNGTEFVFLQSTDTAQVALATRTNTKRNKGEAVVPKLKLQSLSQAQKSPSKSPKPRRGKAVSWKDEPTYFGMEGDDTEEAGERRKADDKPRARKTRRLGAANGTPAPKKMIAADAMDVGTLVPRKRGKAKA